MSPLLLKYNNTNLRVHYIHQVLTLFSLCEYFVPFSTRRVPSVSESTRPPERTNSQVRRLYVKIRVYPTRAIMVTSSSSVVVDSLFCSLTHIYSESIFCCCLDSPPRLPFSLHFSDDFTMNILITFSSAGPLFGPPIRH